MLCDGGTGYEYARYRLGRGEEFSITFIHSVNQTPVTDCYDADGEGNIWLRKTIYYDFGAGVPFDLNEGEVLSYDFLLFVGTVSDHTLRISGETVSLRDLCGRNTKIRIVYRPGLM